MFPVNPVLYGRRRLFFFFLIARLFFLSIEWVDNDRVIFFYLHLYIHVYLSVFDICCPSARFLCLSAFLCMLQARYRYAKIPRQRLSNVLVVVCKTFTNARNPLLGLRAPLCRSWLSSEKATREHERKSQWETEVYNNNKKASLYRIYPFHFSEAQNIQNG